MPLDRFANATDRDRYDAIVCMEVLEHCPSDVQPRIIRDLARLSRPGGVVIISVPIEIGLTLVVKQAVRAAAAASGLTEYAHRERYRPVEFARMLMAGKESQIERPSTTATTAAGATVRFHGHKGFNWHLLERVDRRGVHDRAPVVFTGPSDRFLAQQPGVVRVSKAHERGVSIGASA